MLPLFSSSCHQLPVQYHAPTFSYRVWGSAMRDCTLAMTQYDREDLGRGVVIWLKTPQLESD
jgi:hypothetical protein